MEVQVSEGILQPQVETALSWSESPDSRSPFTYSITTNDFESFLTGLEKGSVDLILTDPPYAISRNSGFRNIGKKSVERFAVSMDFGDWDQQEISLSALAHNAYRTLRKGGTAIVFYDVWKITKLAEALTNAGFVQLRLIEWMKTNPVPINSRVNYLTNAREMAVLAVKGGKPTFNGVYDNGVYSFPIPRGKRLHPTQKPLRLLRELVKKHSYKGDLIVDPFLGSGTTAIATCENDRTFKGCDADANYVSIAQKRVKDYEQKYLC